MIKMRLVTSLLPVHGVSASAQAGFYVDPGRSGSSRRASHGPPGEPAEHRVGQNQHPARVSLWSGVAIRHRFTMTCMLFLILGVCSRADALTLYYVDPDWPGSTTGAASTPWTSLTSSAWATINATLATDDVMVYFSARTTGSDTHKVTTTQ